MKPIQYDLELAQAFYSNPGNLEFYTKSAALLMQQAAPLLPNLPGLGNALDLACGAGFSTRAFQMKWNGYCWFGLDQSKAMLDFATRSPTPIEWILGSAESLPFDDARFELILCNFGLHWLSESSISEVGRVLKANGIFAASVPRVNSQIQSRGQALLLRVAKKIGLQKKNSPAPGLKSDILLQSFSQMGAATLKDHSMVETFTDTQQFAQTLWSRGSLHAIFGSQESEALAVLKNQVEPGPFDLVWPLSLICVTKT